MWGYLGHGASDELVDGHALPVQVLQPLLQELVNVLHLRLEEGALDVEESGQHVVVDVHDQLQVPRLLPVPVFGSRVQGSGFRVQGSGCRVQGARCRVQGSGLRVEG